MTLVNFDGMAFFGPGSEWFWTMLQFMALAITFFAIYRQLRAQRSASVFEQMAAWHLEFEDVRFIHDQLVFLLDLEGREVTAGLPRSAAHAGNFFERFGYLVAQGHLRREDVWNDFRQNIAWYWALMHPYIERSRVIDEQPRLYEWFEYLEREMRRLDLRLMGKPYVDAETLGEAIDGLTAALQRQYDAERGIIPARKVAPPPEPDDA